MVLDSKFCTLLCVFLNSLARGHIGGKDTQKALFFFLLDICFSPPLVRRCLPYLLSPEGVEPFLCRERNEANVARSCVCVLSLRFFFFFVPRSCRDALLAAGQGEGSREESSRDVFTTLVLIRRDLSVEGSAKRERAEATPYVSWG